MHQKLGLDFELIRKLRPEYFAKYGTTLKGLQINHGVNPDDYLAFTHQIPLQNYLHEDKELHSLLQSLPQVKWVFTNSDAYHAGRVLDILNIRDCFAGIIDIYATGFNCKPDPVAFQTAMALSGVDDPTSCVFIDDLERNTLAAKKLGFFTILVAPNPSSLGNNNIHHIGNIHELTAFPGLWNKTNEG